MALSLLTLQSLIRLILCISPLCNSLPSCPLGLLVLITLLGELTSFRLRVVAGRWWEEELILTVSLAHLSDLQKPEADSGETNGSDRPESVETSLGAGRH